MMKKLNLVIVMLVTVVIVFTACSNQSKKVNSDVENSVSFLADENENHDSKIVTETESSTEISTTQTTTAQSTTKPKETEKTTTAKAKQQTTTQRQTTTKKQTTTKEVATTQKPATTKKVTTTEDDWDCNVDGHSCEIGPIGWVNSEAEATDKALEYIGSHDASGSFRVRECYWCGKYTAKITLY